MRRLVIGDIHNNHKGLVQCLERAQVTNQDQLIFLGDLFDGWNDAANLVEFLLEDLVKREWQIPPIFIEGNHDVWVRDYLEIGVPHHLWIKQGGANTLKGLHKLAKTKPHLLRELTDFLKHTELYYITDDNKAFVHGGFTKTQLGQEWKSDVYYWDRTLWNAAVKWQATGIREQLPLPERYSAYDEIFIGHSTVLRLGQSIPLQAINVWNLDTGSGYGGYLTIMDIDTKEFWQSDNVNILYEN